MGYMGLENSCASDMAADLGHNMIDAAVKVLRKELDSGEDNGCFNTHSIVNVALAIEMVGKGFNGLYCEEWHSLIKDTIEKMEKYIKESEKEEWDDESNKLMHITAFKRMLKSMKRILKDKK